MYVIPTESGRRCQAFISRIEIKEIALINKSKRFDFNWNQKKKYEVYKLTCENADEPIGLMSLEDCPIDYAFQIRLIACSKGNIGNNKQYKRIAGCLISFACKKAFTAGYEGYVFLKPKTVLKNHYQSFYGMVSTKMYLVTEGRNSSRLIKEYYEEY